RYLHDALPIHQIGDIGVFVVKANWAAIKPRAVQSRSQRNANGCGLVPFVLSASVDIAVIISEQNVHGLRTRGTDADCFVAHVLRDVFRDLGGAMALAHEFLRPWPLNSAHVGGLESNAQVRQTYGGMLGYAIDNQRDMHGPGLTAGGKFLGAIEWIDNPHAFFV